MSVAVIGAKLVSYLPVVLLTISLLIGVPAVRRYYRQIREEEKPIRDADLLAELEQGNAASKMTEAEFRRVRELLAGSEPQRNAKTRPKPARPKPDKAAAALSPEQSRPTQRPLLGAEDCDNRTEIDPEPAPSG